MCFFLCSPRKYFSRSSVISPGGLVPVIFCPALYRREEQRHFPFHVDTFDIRKKVDIWKTMCLCLCTIGWNKTFMEYLFFHIYKINALKTHLFCPCIKHGGTTLHVNMLAALLWEWPDPMVNVSCTPPSNDIAILLQYCNIVGQRYRFSACREYPRISNKDTASSRTSPKHFYFVQT